MENINRTIGSHIYIADEVASTNTELLEHADQYEHGSVFCPRRQTAGKGRHQREWRSQHGGLYFSVLLKDQTDLSRVYPFVLLSALAVVHRVQSFATHGVAIKWPNDIYINHRKVCGILAESSTRGNSTNVVIGIGINVNNHVSHLTDLRNPAVSLKECCGEELDLNLLFEKIIDELDILYCDILDNRFPEYLPELNRLLYSKGQEIELSVGDKVRLITPLAFTLEAKLRCLENGVE